MGRRSDADANARRGYRPPVDRRFDDACQLPVGDSVVHRPGTDAQLLGNRTLAQPLLQ